MIPFVYRLKEGVRIQERGGSYLVISEVPLNVVRINQAGAKILRLSDGSRTLEEIGEAISGLSAEDTFRISEYFRERGFLERAIWLDEDFRPFVSVIIPTRDRQRDLAECLTSIFAQDYPKNQIEVIVFDDGSKDQTRVLVPKFPCTLLLNERSRGASFCRNAGARLARGEILAFLDSDCVAKEAWLRELVPYFRWKRVGAVGGYVDGCLAESALDRYEKVSSSLNMGKHLLVRDHDRTTFYVPTCNLLVRKDAFEQAGGFREEMQVGEDVDFCWRLRELEHYLLYVPHGMVQHRHRNRLGQFLRRRADYGSSEAGLYRLHRDRKKQLHTPPLGAATFFLASAALLFFSLWLLILSPVPMLLDLLRKRLSLRDTISPIPWRKILFSVIRGHFSAAYFISFHLVRYYMILLLPLGFAFPPLWLFSLCLLIPVSLIDFKAKRPELTFPTFLFYSILEHLSYQIGVLIGCVRRRFFGCYLPMIPSRAWGKEEGT